MKTRPDFIRICFVIKIFFSGECSCLIVVPLFSLGSWREPEWTSDGKSLHFPLLRSSKRIFLFFLLLKVSLLGKTPASPLHISGETLRPDRKGAAAATLYGVLPISQAVSLSTFYYLTPSALTATQ